MKTLYHYSSKHLPDLRARIAQVEIHPEDLEVLRRKARQHFELGAYVEHISFFFDPVPVDILGKLFGPWHHTWKPGAQLWQYEVSLDAFGDCPFDVVESPAAIQLLDSVEWQYDDEIFLVQFLRKRRQMKERLGEVGFDQRALAAAAKKFHGCTRQAFISARQRPDWEDNKNKYAACVPHLMVFPVGGIVPYAKAQQVHIPKDTASDMSFMTW